MFQLDQPMDEESLQFWGKIRYQLIFGIMLKQGLYEGHFLDAPPIPCSNSQSWLGWHALKINVGGVYEAVRLGISVHRPDGNGVTPLALVCGMILATPTKGHDVSKLLHIARILVEQHAEVNITYNGDSLLVIACKTGNWELIELLVLHGACIQPCDLAAPSSFLPQEKLPRNRFAALRAASPRPPRKCPCWSGSDFDKCHGETPLPGFDPKSTLYSPLFYCLCQSGKPYGPCCLKRKAVYEEIWSKEHDRLIGRFGIEVPAPMEGEPMPTIRDLNIPASVGLKRPTYAEMYGTTRPSTTLGPTDLEFRRMVALQVIVEGGLDPAFAFALKESKKPDRYIAPVPYRRSVLTKKEGLDMRNEWNALIDRYIAEAPKWSDSRPHDMIIRYNKINEAGGPFWRICANCHKDEGVDHVQFKSCGKCKSMFYCSTECQKANWPQHKIECPTMEHEEYALLSQRRIIVAEGLALHKRSGKKIPEDLKAALLREGAKFPIF